MIYLDYSATTPVSYDVLESYNKATRDYMGNANSIHSLGVKSKVLLNSATKQICELFNIAENELIYTSGATESNNMALKGVALAYKNRGNHIIVSKLEHPSIYSICDFLQTQGFDKLRSKLEALLLNYKVTIVYPIPYIKQIYLINEYGEIISNRKSPKKGSALEIFKELYKIKSYLKNDNLKFKIIMFNSDEYRDQIPKKHVRSKGYKRNDQIVSEIIKEYDINKEYSLVNLLDDLNLPEVFTTEDVRKKGKVSKKTSSLVLNILSCLGYVEKIGTKNRYNVYKRC